MQITIETIAPGIYGLFEKIPTQEPNVKYVAQPQYNANTVELFEFSPSPTPHIKLGPFSDQPNSALVYEDSSGVAPAFYLFIAFQASSDSGYVNVYDLDAILANESPTPTKLTLTTDQTSGTILPIGMAIRPGTGDLYVATTNNVDTENYGTVNVFTRSAFVADMPYTWGPIGDPVLTYGDSGEGIAGVVSNLAFDLHGNLWLTTFDGNGDYLCCFPVSPGGQPSSTTYYKLGNGAQFSPVPLNNPFSAVPVTLHGLSPFSSPEGIAFDPAGNLWVANNNDDSGDVNPQQVTLTVSNTADILGGSLALGNGDLITLGTPGSTDTIANLENTINTSGWGITATLVGGTLTFMSPNPAVPVTATSALTASGGGTLTLRNTGGGSLTMITSAWIESILYGSANAEVAAHAETIAGYQIAATDPVTTYYLNDNSQFGGLCFDGYTLYINDENNYGSEGSVVWQCDTQSIGDSTYTPAFDQSFEQSSVTTTNPGNGSMSIFNYYAPEQPAPLLTIRDTQIDVGAEPDTTAGGVLWESPDIGVDTSTTHPGYWPGTGPTYPYASNIVTPIVDTPPMPVVGTLAIKPGDSAFVYVKVANYGTAASTGTEILKVYYALWSAGLNWPAPWDGSEFDNAGNPEGGVIGEVQIPQLPPNSEIYLQVPWTNVPNPTNYISAADVQPSHFCLLARIESSSVYPFGMYKPEEVEIAGVTGYETAIMDNTGNNAAIAWRNITISAPGATFAPDFKIIKLSVFGANFGPVAGLFSFGVQTVGAGGKVEPIKAKVIVKAEGKALERLLAAKFEEKRFKHLGEGRFELLDLKRGMSNIHLPAKELLPFTVEFTPEEDRRDFAVRVIQYVHTGGTEEVIGGQTFVIGKVKGFPQRAR